MTDAERTEIRLSVEKLLRQYARHDERGTWAAHHPEDAEVEQASWKSSARFRELICELAEWAGVADADVALLIGEVVEHQHKAVTP